MFSLHVNWTAKSVGIGLLCKTTFFATVISIVVNGSTAIDGDDHVEVGYGEEVDLQ
jgi:hypothetical protein